ncbi:uncharacterized protein LOC131174439 [Hevea brasiliensis]|uniref:uncharacterized protein LOC131174439 n=1 Tax=Hevea brasiliensis TaxID=3981 RepID=UPI0025CB7852|nr:uncharacterized protein LOC131174439 [Hevea brasiliensis]
MVTLNTQEGQSVVRPPFFDGNNFLYWKNRMYYFLKSEGVDLWDVVENGPFTLTKIVNGVHVAKPKGEWSEQEKRRVALNDKAIHVLLCALSRSEYNKVCMKSTAKEIWDALVVTHEGISQVKENKMDSRIYQYELFKMKLDETISEMYDRFAEIIGGIESLGKTFTNEELVKKILRSLPKEWLPKVTSLKDSKDLSKEQLDELLGNLIDYEMTLKKEQVEEPNKAKKTIAFKVSSENSSDEDDEFNEEELALMTRRIRKMLFQNKKFIPKRNFKKDKGESHIRTDCPKLKKPFKKFKKKALKATRDESSDSEDEEIGDQIAQMCFMAMEKSSNEVTLNDDVVEFSYDELVNALKVMNDELELSHKRNKHLKSELASLWKENETSSKVMALGSMVISMDVFELETFSSVFDSRKKQAFFLSSMKEKQKKERERELAVQGKDKLVAILDSQRSPSIKYGLGYSKFTQAPPSKTIFVKASSSNEPSPQMPNLMVSNPRGQEPKTSSGNETRKISIHQNASTQNLESKWYLDSECLRHITGNANLILSLEKKDGGGQVTFGDNGKGKIVGKGKVGKENSPILDKVPLVDSLKHNLLSVNQLCDKGYRFVFESKSCFVSKMSDNKMLFIAKRIKNIYVIDLHALSNKDVKCFVSISDDSWTWHRRLTHASMDFLANLNKDELVDELPKTKFQKDKMCIACQIGKQVKSSFKSIHKVYLGCIPCS